MQSYIIQLVITDTDSVYPSIYTEKINAKDKHDAYNKMLDWTYTITDKPSGDFDQFEMFINGQYPSNFINA